MYSSSSLSKSSNESVPRSLFTIFGRAENVHRKLLYELMSTVHEYLVVTIQSTTSDTAVSVVDQRTTAADESLFVRIHRCVEQIFLNGLRLFKPDVSSVEFQPQSFTHLSSLLSYTSNTRCRSLQSFKICPFQRCLSV